MNDNDEVTVWFNQLAERPETSMEVIWKNYFEKLVSYARRKMRDAPRRHLDEEDIAIDAMNSLFKGLRDGRFPNLNDRDDLWKILLTITARKAYKAIRNNKAQKRGGGVVRGESIFAQQAMDGRQDGIGNVLGSEPTPQLADEVVQQCEELLGKLEDGVLQQIAGMKLEGFSNEEIAAKLDVAVRTVERKLGRIRSLWAS